MKPKFYPIKSIFLIENMGALLNEDSVSSFKSATDLKKYLYEVF